MIGKNPQQVLAELRDWDFGDPSAEPGFRFIEKLVTKTGWTAQYAESAMDEYRRFVVLGTCYPDDVLVPSPAVDKVWHQAILEDTHRYALMCDRFYGRFKHHKSNISQAQQVARRAALVETRERYRDVFGEEPPADIWTEQKPDYNIATPGERAAWADCA